MFGILVGGYFSFFYSPYKFRGDGAVRVLILNSYDLDNFWSTEQIRGFEDYFDKQGVDLDVEIFNMGFFEQATEEEKRGIVSNATRLIEKYDPDLVYAVGDLAKINIAVNYVDSSTPWVFSGLTAVHGFEVGSKNMAGVTTILKISRYLDFFDNLSPGVRRLVMINGDDDTSRVIADSMIRSEEEFAEWGAELVGLEMLTTFDEFKERVLYYQDKADFFVFDDFAIYVDDGEVVAQDVVVRWLVENSRVPSFTYDESAVEEGILCSINPSFSGQGKSVAEYAYDILIEGEAPSSIGFNDAVYVERHINLARANDLDLYIPSAILVNSYVYEAFPWESSGV